MRDQCPNCGRYGNCGCTWSEQIAAHRIKERERRRSGFKKVIVDHIGSFDKFGHRTGRP